jgi:cytochrome oxidase assembly protein ShyY1
VIRQLLAPRWLAWHAALVVVLVSFTLFGRWQLHAFESAGRDATLDRPPVPITAVAEPGQRLRDAAVSRPVTVTGRYEAQHQLLVPGRRLDGRAGYLVVTPLRTATGVVPVNRGWVARAPATGTGTPSGAVTVRGVLQPSEPEDEARVDLLDQLPAGQVPYLATVQLLAVLPYPAEELYDGYVVLTGQRPAAVGGPTPVRPQGPQPAVGPWRNLAYALQWWLFAGAAVVFWWMVLRRAAGDRAATDRAATDRAGSRPD